MLQWNSWLKRMNIIALVGVILTACSGSEERADVSANSAAIKSVSKAATAKSIISEKCIEEFDNENGCECASRKTEIFSGPERFNRYIRFFALFSERAAGAASVDAILGEWNSSMERYAKNNSEEYFNVTGWVQDMEAVYRYALSSCSIQRNAENNAPSLFFWGEGR